MRAFFAGLFKRPERPCVHLFCEDTTLRILTASAVGEPMYYVRCKSCGACTDVYLTAGEAIAAAKRGWIQ